MTTRYLRSTDGNNVDSGLTWALAKANYGSVTLAAGDTIWVSQNHSESYASDLNASNSSTAADPTYVLCGNDGAEPPTALATTAVIATTTGSISGLGSGGPLFFYGITFRVGVGETAVRNMFLGQVSAGLRRYDNCSFQIATTNDSAGISIGSATGGQTEFYNCTIKFAADGQGLIQSLGSKSSWFGGSLLSGGTSPTALVHNISTGSRLFMHGFDLSNASASINLTDTTGAGLLFVFRNCKLPSSWSGVVASGTIGINSRFELFNCDSGDTNYRLWIEDAMGTIRDETTIVRTGGASDGTTSLSWKMTTGANAEFPIQQLYSPERAVWNETTGSAKTLTVEIVHDSQGAGSGSKFQDDEVWLEVMYLGTSGFPLGTWITDRKDDILATAANQADSSVTWTTTGLTTPVKQALSVTFTPQEKGHFIYRIAMAKASKVCYVDPVATVS